MPAHEQCDGEGSVWVAEACYRLAGSANTYSEARHSNPSVASHIAFVMCISPCSSPLALAYFARDTCTLI